MPKDSEDPRRTRITLLSRLRKSDDPALWDEFDRIYRPMVFQAVVRDVLNHHDAEDITQEILTRISQQIRTGKFKYDPTKGKFRGVLKTTATWRVRDYFRKRKRHPQLEPKSDEGTSNTPIQHRIPAPAPDNDALSSDRERQQALLAAALELVKRKVKPKQFQIFDAYVLKEWPVPKVMQSLLVSRTQVFLAKHRILKSVKQEIKRLEARGL
ncbi:MAG: sigma-70 family RNA polymerase sigma factor [Verrucomicrobiales bacterium]|nr:sigma-70 family RNA polymerase sigma factor [Verrucomicrobiales bacterium]